jgi:hypothetical protein
VFDKLAWNRLPSPRFTTPEDPGLQMKERRFNMSVQMILIKAGALPITETFKALSNQLMYLEVNGSVWSQKENQMIGIAIALDDKPIGTANIFSNGSSTHRAVVPAYLPVQLAEGQHTLTLSVANSFTTSDLNDFYTAVIHY